MENQTSEVQDPVRFAGQRCQGSFAETVPVEYRLMLNVLNILLPIFLVILVGFTLGKLKRLDMTTVVDVRYYIGLPALAFTAMLSKRIVLLEASQIWASALVVIAGTRSAKR